MHLVVRDAAAVVDRLERDVAAAAMADVADNVEYRQHGLLGVGLARERAGGCGQQLHSGCHLMKKPAKRPGQSTLLL